MAGSAETSHGADGAASSGRDDAAPGPPLGNGGDGHPGAASDEQLVETIKREGMGTPGGKHAWSELIVRYQDKVFGLCIRVLGDRDWAADLAQDALVKVIQGIEQYDGRSKVGTWIYRVTMNACLSHLRSQRLRKHTSLDTEVAHGQFGPGLGETSHGTTLGAALDQTRELAGLTGVESIERRGLVAEALRRLPLEQRSILVLRDVQGLEYEQIAEVLEVAVGTVKSRLFRARVALRESFESLYGGAGERKD